MTTAKQSREKKYINLAAAIDLQNDDKILHCLKSLFRDYSSVNFIQRCNSRPCEISMMELFEKIANDF